VRRRGGVVGLEDVEALELLVQDGERLELLCLLHLRLEPVLDLILLFLDEVLVVVVEVSDMIRSVRWVVSGGRCTCSVAAALPARSVHGDFIGQAS
jgi:hypothetical protein